MYLIKSLLLASIAIAICSAAKPLDELKNSQAALAKKVQDLEEKLLKTTSALKSLTEDYKLSNPTAQYEYISFNVPNLTEVVKPPSKVLSIPFDAGQAIGAVSSWMFALSFENDSIGIDLVLVEEHYHKGALFAGFSLNILDEDDNVYLSTSSTPINFYDVEDKTLRIPNIISVTAVRDPENKLLLNGTDFRLDLRMELLGRGHKLYKQEALSPATQRDTQTVAFDVDDISTKMDDDATSITLATLAHTSFQLSHSSWKLKTNWSVEVRKENDGMSLYVQLEEMTPNWEQLFVSFKLDIIDSDKEVIEKHVVPIHDYKKELFALHDIISSEKLEHVYQSLTGDNVELKLHLTVYGKNARYYLDI